MRVTPYRGPSTSSTRSPCGSSRCSRSSMRVGSVSMYSPTLALWWRSARPRLVEKNASAQKKVAPPQAQHPLLAALGGRSLDLGLREWEATHGIDLEVHAAVRAVQSLLYGPRKGVEEDAMAAQV